MKYADFEPTELPTIDVMSDLIKDKRVCDAGCGDGYFASAMLEHASYVRGYDIDSVLVEQARKNGIDAYKKSFLDGDYSDIDVVYAFVGMYGMYALGHVLEGWNGILISNFYPLQTMPWNMIEPDQYRPVQSGGYYSCLFVYNLGYEN